MTAFPGGERFRRLSGAALAALLAVAIVVVLAGAGARNVPATTAFGLGRRIRTAGPAPGRPLPAWWPKRATLLTDSVGLGAVTALREAMPDWHLKVLGHPALMVDEAADDLVEHGTQVDKVVVVALGYNSLWERGREDFDYWSGLFDRNARRMVRTLHAAGARKIVWVTLRDAPRSRSNPRTWISSIRSPGTSPG